MRKFFTCISLAAASMVMTANPAMAQQQITDSEKAAFVKAAVPAMLEQVKQISGIDFVSLANPGVKEIINSPLFGTQSMLRADAVSVSLQPDSMVMDLSKVSIEGMPPMVSGFMKDVKITFNDYKDFNIKTAFGANLNTSIPQEIKASAANGLVNISLKLVIGEKKGLLPFSTLTANLDLGGLDALIGSVMPELSGIKSGVLVDMKENGTASVYNYDITLGETVVAIIDMLNKDDEDTPAPAAEAALSKVNLTVKVDMTALQSKGLVKANVFNKADNAVLPLVDGDLFLNPEKLAQGKFQADSLIETNYIDGTNKVEDYEKTAWIYDTKASKQIKNKEFSYSKVKANDPWKFDDGTLDILTGNLELNNNFLIGSVINSIIADLASGNVNSFKAESFTLNSETDEKGILDETVTVKPEMVGTQAGKVTVSMRSDINDDGTIDATDLGGMDFVINLPTKSETIRVDFNPVNVEGTISKLYVKSNLMGLITDNETIEEEVEKVKVSTLGNAIRVQNGKGNYVVVNLVGKVISAGVITSDDQYINTPSLPNGIYMISINEAGTNNKTTVKFVR